MRAHKIASIFFVFIMGMSSISYAQSDGELYSQARREVKADNANFAFMHFHSLYEAYPDSKYAERALFAMGEYYFMIADYYNASTAFGNFIDEYPDSKALPFALAYLLKIAAARQEASLIETLRNKIMNLKQLSLLFQESKAYTYTSAYLKKYRMVSFIDKIEFYVDGELFEEISY